MTRFVILTWRYVSAVDPYLTTTSAVSLSTDEVWRFEMTTVIVMPAVPVAEAADATPTGCSAVKVMFPPVAAIATLAAPIPPTRFPVLS